MFPQQPNQQVPGVLPGGTPAPAAQPMLDAIPQLDMDVIKRRAAEVAKATANNKPSDFYTFKVGPNFVRFLPPWNARAAQAQEWTKFRSTHYKVVGGNVMTCYEATFPKVGFVCPVCGVLANFERYLSETLKDLHVRSARYANGLVYDYDEATQTFHYRRLKPYVIRIPLSVYSDLMQIMGQPGARSLASVTDGSIVNIIRPPDFKGKKGYSTLSVWQGPLADGEVLQQIWAQRHDLDTFADFGLPTIAKLQEQAQIAETFLTSCCTAIGSTREQMGLGPIQLVVPQVVHDAEAARAAQAQAAAVQAPVAVAVPTGLPPTMPAPAPLPAVATASPVQMPVTAPLPPVQAPTLPPAQAPTLPPVQTLVRGAVPMPPVPALPGGANPLLEELKAGIPATSPPPVLATPPPILGAVPTPPVSPPAVAAGPTPVVPAAQVAPATAPAVSDDVLCPGCGRTFKGTAGLKIHLSKGTCSVPAPVPAAASAPPAQVPAPAAPVPQVPAGVPAAPPAAPVVAVGTLPRIGPDGRPECFQKGVGNLNNQHCVQACLSRPQCF